MRHRFKVVLEWDPEEQAWTSVIPALNYLSTWGDTRDHALEMTREAIELYLETADQDEIPAYSDETITELVDVEVGA